jgi:hypothetical protein
VINRLMDGRTTTDSDNEAIGCLEGLSEFVLGDGSLLGHRVVKLP